MKFLILLFACAKTSIAWQGPFPFGTRHLSKHYPTHVESAHSSNSHRDGLSVTPISAERSNLSLLFLRDLKSELLQCCRVLALATVALLSPLPAHAEIPEGLPVGKRYWSIVHDGEPHERVAANTALLDYAVGTINTMYYDNSGGARFQPRDFYSTWKAWLREQPETALETRPGAIQGLEWLVSQLNDPFSRYLTREQLRAELAQSNHGFLGLGAMVESPDEGRPFFGSNSAPVIANLLPKTTTIKSPRKTVQTLSAAQVAILPVVTAVTPDSPAERAGLVVGDRIVAVGEDNILTKDKSNAPNFVQKYSSAENYIGHPDLTIAKPVYASSLDDEAAREVIVGYRPMRVRLTTVLTADTIWSAPQDELSDDKIRAVRGGNSIVHYELLNRKDTIFDQYSANVEQQPLQEELDVGYIRLTRFSRVSTAGFVEAVDRLEKAGATSFIIDLRNNYGGVIQEAMLTASTLIRDPHAVLCYTLNSRGGFTPHDVEEYVVDKRYPGYLLSAEAPTVTLEQVKRESPDMFDANGSHWVPPSSFASLREQRVKRGIHPVSMTRLEYRSTSEKAEKDQLSAQKNIVLLINEGTASSAEVFASALHDNSRTVALIGTKTYGKGLIQHTFPMPDGGGLRLTVAEYLTP